MASTPVVPEYSQVTLKSLKLRSGMFLQAQRVETKPPPPNQEAKPAPVYEAQFLGPIQDKALVVIPVGMFSIKTGMMSGEIFTVRGFTGQYDFHFTSRVLQAVDFTFRDPGYAYAVLTYPAVVEARQVRKSMRIRTSLPANATLPDATGEMTVTLVDLSIDGTLVRSASALGAVGDLVALSFTVTSDLGVADLVVAARICHSNEDPGEEGILAGLLFENITGADRVVLKDFVLSNLE
jgi:hypothetical protein